MRNSVEFFLLSAFLLRLMFSETFPGCFLSEPLIGVSNSARSSTNKLIACNGIDSVVPNTTTFFLFLPPLMPDGLPYSYYIQIHKWNINTVNIYDMTCAKAVLQPVTELLRFVLTGTDL